MRTMKIFAVVLLWAGLAGAQASRTWVSGVGDDANPCSRTAPCKAFAGAISKTAAGGEIDAMDPGGFGALTITKAITVEGMGSFAYSTTTASTWTAFPWLAQENRRSDQYFGNFSGLRNATNGTMFSVAPVSGYPTVRLSGEPANT